MRKIVITGGCGFIGSHLTEFLFKKFKSTHFVILDKITYDEIHAFDSYDKAWA